MTLKASCLEVKNSDLVSYVIVMDTPSRTLKIYSVTADASALVRLNSKLVAITTLKEVI